MFPGADGQLCNTFFKHFIVEFDFINNEVLLHNPEKFKYNGNGSVLNMQLTGTGTHAVPFSFTLMNGKSYTDQIDIDFGGIYPLKIAKDLLAAISLAGSFTGQAKVENALVMRWYDPDKEPLVMMPDLKALLSEADLKQNVQLEDGDLVYVPRMKIEDVNEWVENMKPFLATLLWPGEKKEMEE